MSASENKLPLRSHRLKTEENAWDAIERGDKTAEFRKNDRDYRVGDQLILERGTDEKRHLTLHRTVTHALYGPSFGIPEGYAMLSLGLCGCATHEIQQSKDAATADLVKRLRERHGLQQTLLYREAATDDKPASEWRLIHPDKHDVNAHALAESQKLLWEVANVLERATVQASRDTSPSECDGIRERFTP